MEWIIGIIVLWIVWKLLTSKSRRELVIKQIIVDAYIHHEGEIVYSKIYWEAAKRYAEDHGATIDKYFDEDSFNYDTYINEVKVHVYIARDSSGYALFKVEEHKKMMQKFNEKFGIIDESWIERLWKWADENEISDDEIPRNKEKLLNLTELSLNFNQLTELPKEIGNLTNLISLHLGGNQLTELPKEIGNLTNLTSLHLFENQLTELPKEIGNLSNLTELHLLENQLTELPKEIGNLTNLTGLNLGGNQFTELPKEIGNLTNLTGLYLRGNKLTELTKEIGNLTNLRRLDLTNSPNLILTSEQKEWIRELISKYGTNWWDGNASDDDLLNREDDEIPLDKKTDLVDDGWIDRLLKWADENEISDNKIPRNKEKLLNLTKLDLCYNSLTELAKEITNLSNLTSLDLGSNQLTELPKEIGNLTNLTMLDLDSNQLTELPKEITNLSNLTMLDLTNNRLTELPKEIGNLFYLSSLYLGGNQLTELPKEITNLILKSLDLEDSPNLILTSEQKKWIRGLISKYGTAWDGIHIGINIDNDLLDKEDDEEIPF